MKGARNGLLLRGGIGDGTGTAGRWDGAHESASCSAGGLATVAAASAAAAAASIDSHITVKAMGRTGIGQQNIWDGKA